MLKKQKRKFDRNQAQIEEHLNISNFQQKLDLQSQTMKNYNFKPKLNSKRAPSRQAEVTLKNENSILKNHPYVKSKNEGLCKVMIVLPKNLKSKSS